MNLNVNSNGGSSDDEEEGDYDEEARRRLLRGESDDQSISYESFQHSVTTATTANQYYNYASDYTTSWCNPRNMPTLSSP